MLASSIPAKFPIPFASGAGAGFVDTIPTPSQAGGRASLTDGFPPLNFQPVGAGGIPPFGQDVNGLQLQITAWIQWVNAGAPVAFDATFSAAIGGYPKGALVESATSFGTTWLSLVDNNTTNPDAGGAGWRRLLLGAGGADYCADTGTANALIVAPSPPVGAYFDGLTLLVRPAHANTAAATIAVNGLSAVPIINSDGSAMLAGEIGPDSLMRLCYLGGSFQYLNAPYALTRAANSNNNLLATTAYADRAAANALGLIDFYAGALYGLITAPTPGSPTTSITVAAGACRDSANSIAMKLLTPMAKTLTATWAAGTGNGGRMDATALANGQTWFIVLLINPTTGAVDWGYSQSPTAPLSATVIAAGFTKFRIIWFVLLDAAATTIRAYEQVGGDWMMLITRSADYAVAANGGTPFHRQMTAPVGIKTMLLVYFQDTGTVDSNAYISRLSDPDEGTPGTLSGPTQWGQIRRLAVNGFSGLASYGTVMATVWTDTAGKIYTDSNDPSDVIALGVKGIFWQRGKYF